jgi:hypothetical protein
MMSRNDNIHAEKVRQLVEAMQEFLAPVPIYMNLIWDYAALGNAAGVQMAMHNLAIHVRAAVATSIELAELRASHNGGNA